jgi:hypothetical protein
VGESVGSAAIQPMIRNLDKPKRMRWTTYHRLMDKLVAAERLAERIADQWLMILAARLIQT